MWQTTPTRMPSLQHHCDQESNLFPPQVHSHSQRPTSNRSSTPTPSLMSSTPTPSLMSSTPTPSLMSSTPTLISTPSNFDLLFDEALSTYSKETGKDLRLDPLALKISTCDTPDGILAVLRDALALNTPKNDDFKLFRWLEPVVRGLHALDAGPHSVSHNQVRCLPFCVLQLLFSRYCSLHRRFFLLSVFSSTWVSPVLSPTYSL